MPIRALEESQTKFKSDIPEGSDRANYQSAEAVAAATVSTTIAAVIATITTPIPAATLTAAAEVTPKQASVDSNTSGHGHVSRQSSIAIFHRGQQQDPDEGDDSDYVVLSRPPAPSRIQVQNMELVQHFLRIYAALRVATPFKICRSNTWSNVDPETGETKPNKKCPNGKNVWDTVIDINLYTKINTKSTTAVAWKLVDMPYETELQQNQLVATVLKESMGQSCLATAVVRQNGPRFFNRRKLDKELTDMSSYLYGGLSGPDVDEIKGILKLPEPQAVRTCLNATS